jgi:hypothetical protein
MKKLMVLSLMLAAMASGAVAQIPRNEDRYSASRLNDNYNKNEVVNVDAQLTNVIVPYTVAGTIIIISPDNALITHVAVFDAGGRLVLTDNSNAGYIAISADRLRTGVHFVKIWIGGKAIIRQIYKA